jgi:hypothetical protein
MDQILSELRNAVDAYVSACPKSFQGAQQALDRIASCSFDVPVVDACQALLLSLPKLQPAKSHAQNSSFICSQVRVHERSMHITLSVVALACTASMHTSEAWPRPFCLKP